MSKSTKLSPATEKAVSRLEASLAEAGAALGRPQASTKEPFALEIPLSVGKTHFRLLVGVKSTGAPVHIRVALARMRSFKVSEREHLLFICPFLGPHGRDLCRELGVGYADAAGNCHLCVPGMLISRTVDENPLAETIPIRRLFSPRASRIARALLDQPQRQWTQLELSRLADVSLGHVNNVVRRLLEQDYVRLIGGKVALPEPRRLLQAWQKHYDFSLHSARHLFTLETFPEFETRLAAYSEKTGAPCALTAFAGAAHRAPHVRYGRFHAYFSGDTTQLIRDLELREAPTGANVILLRPADDGVYYQLRKEGSLNIVCDTQLYLDLLSSGERGEEQAEHLLKETMPALSGEAGDSASEAAFHRFLEQRDLARAEEEQGHFAAACVTYMQALATLGKVRDRDVSREKEHLRLLQWLAALQAGIKSEPHEYFALAASLYASPLAAEKAAKTLDCSEGRLRLGLLLYHLLKARSSSNRDEQNAALEKARDYHSLVKSRHTEDHARYGPRAAAAWAKGKTWFGGRLD